MNTRRNSTITSPPDQVTSAAVSKEDAALKNVPIKCDEELPTASEVSLEKEEGLKTLGVSWNPASDTINFKMC